VGATPVKTTLHTLKLLVPAVIPSWRFFDTIAPSPRIEFALLETAQQAPVSWQEFRPRSARLSVGSMLKRLLWNPRWNETLFLVSCAERLMSNPTEHSSREILNRIKAELDQETGTAARPPYLQFRLVFLSRHDGEILKHILYTSPVQRACEDAAP